MHLIHVSGLIMIVPSHADSRNVMPGLHREVFSVLSVLVCRHSEMSLETDFGKPEHTC